MIRPKPIEIWITETNTSTKSEQILNESNQTSEMNHDQMQLTEFLDSGETIKQDIASRPQLILNNATNPYPDQTPYQILTRNYKLAQYTWGPATAPFVIDFPNALCALPVIAERLEPFLYMRAGVKIEVKINATQFHYGAFMISWLPNHVGTTHAANLYMQSGNRPLILSPAVQNSCTFTIPWINPYNYFPTSAPTSQICKVFFTPLTPLGRATDNVSDTVNIQIYGSFVDPEVAGFIAQSGNTMKSESRKKTGSGVIDTIDTVSRTITTVLDKIPIIGGAIENVLSYLSILDKPTTSVTMQPVTLSFARDLSLGTGLDYSNQLSLHPLTAVSMDYSLMGETTDSMSVYRVAQTPMIIAVNTFQGSSQSFNIPITAVSPSLNDYFSFISRMFNYWRGSIKIMLCFYCSTFTSCRFRVSVLYNATAPTDATSGDVVSQVIDVKGDTMISFTVPYLWQTMYRYVLDPTFYPRLLVQQISPVIGPSVASDPAIYCVTWRAAGEDIKFNQLVTYTPTAAPEEELEPVQAQMDPQAEFKKSFEPILKGSFYIKEQGAITGEEISSLHDVVKRYVENTPDPTNSYPQPGAKPGAFHYVGGVFKYWRGARRLKCRPKDTGELADLAIMQNPSNSIDTGNGATLTVNEVWPFLESEVPWYSTIPYYPVRPLAATTIVAGDAPRSLFYSSSEGASSGLNYISGGDDFTFGFLVAPDLTVPSL